MKSKHKVKDFCLFGLPGLFCFFAVVIIPFIYGVYLTFTDWDGVFQEKHFIWFGEFQRRDPGRGILDFPAPHV